MFAATTVDSSRKIQPWRRLVASVSCAEQRISPLGRPWRSRRGIAAAWNAVHPAMVRLWQSLWYGLLVVSLSQEGFSQDHTRGLGQEIRRIHVGSAVRSLAWSPDQRHLVAVADRWLMSWDPSNGSTRWKVPYWPYLADNPIAFLEGGSRIIVHYSKPQTPDDRSNHRYALTVIDAESGRTIQDVQFDQPGPRSANRALAFDLSENGRAIAFASGGGGAVIGSDTTSWRETWRILGNRPVNFLVFDDRRDRLILANTNQGMMQVWHPSSKTRQTEFATYKTGLRKLLLDRRTGHIVTGGDGALQPDRGQPGTLRGVEDDPETLVRAWDPVSGNLIRSYVGPGRNVDGLALSPDGRYVVAAKSRVLPTRKDAYVLAWDATSGQLLAASNYGQGVPAALTFSPDGRRLAISADGSIHILDLGPQLLPMR
ncbi:MAG: WD40 repeat domain-containing protein [Pseudomonadota bacterium]